MKTKNIFHLAVLFLTANCLPARHLLLLLLAGGLPTFSFAQSPQAFKYQSIVRDASGNPMASAAVSVRATVHDGSSTGPVVYQETHAVTTNQFGLINLEIGNGTVVSGVFSSIAWGSGSKWMEIEADFGAGYLPMGTSQLLSVPYSLYSGNGTPGPTGPAGTAGATGPTGSIGPNGPTGAQGNAGATGASGANGSTGSQGYSCWDTNQNGINDPSEDVNSDSFWNVADCNAGVAVPGPTGPTGAAGATGPAGSAGPTGAQGNAGATGPSGADGATGAQGPTGAAGANGATGAAGSTGPTGAASTVPGPTGPTGSGGGWSLTGNAGTVDGTNFIGTTDNIPFNIRVNNQKAGRVRWDGATAGETFLGYQAGNSNTDPYSVGIGFQALFSNTTGSENTACGTSALYSNTTGFWNTACGVRALFSNTIGSMNTASGYRALYSNTTGSENTASGYQVLYSNTTGSYNTISGYQALYYNTTGNMNTASGYSALFYNTTGYGNTALGINAGNGAFGVDFNQCTFIGSYSSPTVSRTNVTMLGSAIASAQCTGDDQVCVGNTAILATGLRAAVTGWTAYSDARYKTNVKEDVAGLDFILKLKPVTYNVRPLELHKIWGTPDSLVSKIDHSEAEKETRIGFLAQDVEKAAKESGFSFPGIDVPRNEKEVYTLRYVDFIMPMVKGMQEQQQEIIDYKLRIINLETDNKNLKAEVEKIKNQLGMEAVTQTKPAAK